MQLDVALQVIELEDLDGKAVSQVGLQMLDMSLHPFNRGFFDAPGRETLEEAITKLLESPSSCQLGMRHNLAVRQKVAGDVGIFRKIQSVQLDAAEIVFRAGQCPAGRSLIASLQGAAEFLTGKPMWYLPARCLSEAMVVILSQGCGKNQRHNPHAKPTVSPKWFSARRSGRTN
jgi:hypothetical protein